MPNDCRGTSLGLGGEINDSSCAVPDDILTIAVGCWPSASTLDYHGVKFANSFFSERSVAINPGFNLFQRLKGVFDFEGISFSTLKSASGYNHLFGFNQAQVVALNAR